MKKYAKIPALILAVVMLAVSLCSCQYLDDMREHRAFYTDDTKREIRFNNNLYKILSPGKLSLVFTELMQADMAYRVTKENVPVLVSNWEGDIIEVNSDQTFIMTFGAFYNSNPNYYVREDIFDQVKETLENANLDHYFFGYYPYDEYEEPWQAHQRNVLLDDQTTEIIHNSLNLPTNDKVSYKELSAEAQYCHTIRLSGCDANMLVMDGENTTYLIKCGKLYYVWNGNEYDEYSICPVSEEDAVLIAKLFDDHSGAVEDEDIAWYFENNYYNYDDYDDVVEGTNIYL